MVKRDIITSVILSIVMALPTTLIFSFYPDYSQALLVPNTSIDSYRGLNQKEQQQLVQSSNGLRSVSRMEKVIYLLRATPETYILLASIMFIPMFLVSIITSLLVKRNAQT